MAQRPRTTAIDRSGSRDLLSLLLIVLLVTLPFGAVLMLLREAFESVGRALAGG